MMNVVQIVSSGPEIYSLAKGERGIPRPGDGEVLIEVAAAGVNGHDLHQLRHGGHPLQPGETDLPGLEVAGRIIEVGRGVDRWKVGDAVCALLRGGGYAGYAVAPDGQCLPIPDGLTWVEAASLPEACFTIWSNIIFDAELAAGETFLMNGGTSGIGVMAIQMFAALGHDVFATARGEEKARYCERLGATRGIDYEAEDFPEVIFKATSGRGVDVILDIVGGDYVAKDLDALANGGRAIFIGGARGYKAEIDLTPIIRKELSISGSRLRPRSLEFKRRVATDLEQRLWPLVSQGKVRPVVDRTFPLSEAADAVLRLERRQHIGKLVLEVANLDRS